MPTITDNTLKKITLMQPSYTKEQIENRTSDYVCFDCGWSCITEEQIARGGVVTAHVSKCGLCQQEKPVTHIRAFNWLRKK